MKIKNKICFVLWITFFLMLVNFNFVVGYSINYNNGTETFQEVDDLNSDILAAPDWYNKPNSYAQLVQWYEDLEDQYPDYIKVFKANELYDTGQATGGYDLYYIRITNESLGLNKPEVLFLGGPHGDETVGTVGLYWFTDWLMRMAFSEETNDEFTSDYLKWVIDNREIYIEASHNPYGFDHGPQRYDGNGWDLNREADYDGPGSPTGGIWASVQGQTLVEFVNDHQIRLACDFHGGARMLLYPWADAHPDVQGVSQITGATYGHAPPDFYFFDAAGLRVGDYMGNYGGDLNYNNIGTVYEIIWYSVKGGIANWGYGADVVTNPAEDPYVNDEIFGNYPGAGILWMSPEMSQIYNPSQDSFGNDTIDRYGAEVRRYVLHQTDLAQPYIRWETGTIENNSEVDPGTIIPLFWQVNGSLVVDHTYIQWGKNPDPINSPDFTTSDYDEHANDYYGGTGWDGAESGTTNGVTYNENIELKDPGTYYFVVKAQVDQVYSNILRPDVYGDNPYLRIIKERTNDEYYEVLEGNDGTDEIIGQTWWYSPIIQIKVKNKPPQIPNTPQGSTQGKPDIEYTFSTSTTDPEGEEVFYQWDFGDGTISNWFGPFESGTSASASHTWTEKGLYNIKVKAKDMSDAESDWSQPLPINIPRYRQTINTIFSFISNNNFIINKVIYIIKQINNILFSSHLNFN